MSEVSTPSAAPVLPKVKSAWGQKIGMTQIFGSAGAVLPVTAVLVPPASVTEVLTAEKNGYSGIRVAFGEVKEKNISKPALGVFKKANVAPARWQREIRLSSTDGFSVGQTLTAAVFAPGDYIDVIGTSKGRGFAGAMKRHNFGGGPSTHGQSDRARATGSSGSNTYPGRVFKGKRFPGHFGVETTTVQHLEVVDVKPEENLVLVKGAVPGPKQSLLFMTQTVKRIKVKTVHAPEAGKKGKKDAKAPAAAAAPAAKAKAGK